MYVRPTSTRLFRGMLIPAIRAISRSPLPLLVTGVLADHQDRAMAADDLALLAHRLYRRSYFHDPLRTGFLRGALDAGSDAATTARNAACSKKHAPESASAHASRAQASSGGGALGVLVPRSEDPGALGGHRDGELEMGRQRPVLGVDRPVVVAHPGGVSAGRDH